MLKKNDADDSARLQYGRIPGDTPCLDLKLAYLTMACRYMSQVFGEMVRQATIHNKKKGINQICIQFEYGFL